MYTLHGDSAAVLTNFRGVVNSTEDELGSAVVAAADVRDIGLALDEVLGRAEVAELEDPGLRVQQQILRLYVSVADT